MTSEPAPADPTAAADPAAAEPAPTPTKPGPPGGGSGSVAYSTAAGLDRPLTRGERAFYQTAAGVIRVFGYLLWRVHVEGRENIPTDGPYVISPVHRSNIDTVLMGYVARRHLRYMAKDTLFKHRWSARLLSALGGFPVNRETADREALRTCEAALKRGEPVVIFPEGTRKSGPVVTDLFQGAAFVALRAGAPIVPVGIGGSAGAMPKGSKFLHPVKIRILIGAPIRPPAREGAGARGTRRHVHELTAQLQQELQRLFDQAEGRRGAGPTGHDQS
jgi:1-acyl-sn-glycerol-3-phosphate acyltransferase